MPASRDHPDHTLFRDGLKGLLESEPGFVVVGEATDGPMPRMGGIEALSGLSGLRTRVIILAAVISEGDVLKAIQSGARGVMLKDAATRELLDGIHRVINGSHVVGDDTLDSLADAVCRPSGPLRDRRFRLTTRELDIVSAMMARRSNGEIADHLSISVQTVKHHLTTIFDKTRVSSRLELAQFAAAQRLVNDGRFA